ncbi:MAG: type II asparaginase [Thermoanaerobaculales bacterium]
MRRISWPGVAVVVCVASLAPLAAQPVASAPSATALPAPTKATASVPVLPRVVVLATGGTIAGTGATSTTTVGYTVANLGVQTLLEAVPELKRIAEVRGEQVFQIASENMTPQHWLKLAARVNELLAGRDTDGVVITHGTDTIEETAYFLDLTVRSDKAVVIVGAMRPSTALSADGPMNLYNAVLLARSKAAIGKGVLVCLNDQINAGREVTKTNTSELDTFRTPELGFLGVISGGKPVFYRQPSRRHTRNSEFGIGSLTDLPRVDIVPAYAGSGRGAVDAAVAAGAKGIVYAGVGDGSIALDVRPALAAARAKGIVVVRSSRVGSGIVARNGEVNDDAFDFVAADNLNPQKARVLLMLALTRTSDTHAIQQIFWEY